MPLLVILFFVFFLLSVLAPSGVESNHYPNLFYNYFAQKVESRFLISVFNFLFVGIGLVLISIIAINQEIVDKQNYFPVFLYLIISVSSVQPHQISPHALSNALILFAMLKLLDTYREERVLNQVFEAAFLLSLCGFVTISSILTFPLFFVVLVILRPFYWREWVVAVIGFASPLFLYESVAYLTNFKQWYFVEATDSFFSTLKAPSFSEFYLPFMLLLLLLLLLSVAHGFIAGFGNTVKKQRTRSILLWFLLLTGLGFFSGGTNSSSVLMSYAFPLSFFIGDFLFGLRQIKIANTILFLLLLALAVIFLAHYDLL